MNAHELAEAAHRTRKALLDHYDPAGCWRGELSSSALATAVAAFALAQVDRHTHAPLIARGLDWLCTHANSDGGWGDTVFSQSNLSTTLLAYCALTLDQGERARRARTEAQAWLAQRASSRVAKAALCRSQVETSSAEVASAQGPKSGDFGYRTKQTGGGIAAAEPPREPPATSAETSADSHAGGLPQSPIGTSRLDPELLADALHNKYGSDRTFAVPILTMAAMAGVLDGAEGDRFQAWRRVQPLPFELAMFPHGLYKWLNLSVVSYALPALIAVGWARFENAPPRNPVLRLLRAFAVGKTSRLLEAIQPSSGGFLEAVPLSAFVAMSLVAAGRRDHPVVDKAAEFLVRSMRSDGSWPIDSDLATWLTTLSINAMAGTAGAPNRSKTGATGSRASEPEPLLTLSDDMRVADWLVAQQFTEMHPFTRAAPGGWGWTDLPGSVPDADDTAGALIALRHLATIDGIRETSRAAHIRQAAVNGIRWLCALQNRDGGVPTFCRGWGKLPFDQSAPDLTGHALWAWSVWYDALPRRVQRHVRRAMKRAVAYLRSMQTGTGFWIPLWFGNEDARGQANPVYGTARVLKYVVSAGGAHWSSSEAMLRRAANWLLSVQHDTGGWGGDGGIKPSIEETAVAVDALATLLRSEEAALDSKSRQRLGAAVHSGRRWLVETTHGGTHFPPSPIGLYFAKLWYSERLYPIVFTLAALHRS